MPALFSACCSKLFRAAGLMCCCHDSVAHPRGLVTEHGVFHCIWALVVGKRSASSMTFVHVAWERAVANSYLNTMCGCAFHGAFAGTGRLHVSAEFWCSDLAGQLAAISISVGSGNKSLRRVRQAEWLSFCCSPSRLRLPRLSIA
jgi:hypothetical protein